MSTMSRKKRGAGEKNKVNQTHRFSEKSRGERNGKPTKGSKPEKRGT